LKWSTQCTGLLKEIWGTVGSALPTMRSSRCALCHVSSCGTLSAFERIVSTATIRLNVSRVLTVVILPQWVQRSLRLFVCGNADTRWRVQFYTEKHESAHEKCALIYTGNHTHM
jgi:hypothetical protein